MRITLERDGKTEVVEVAPDLSSATLEGQTVPVTVVAESSDRVELEIAGQRVLVENWFAHHPEPPGPVDIDGERYTIRVQAGPSGAKAAPAARIPRGAARTAAGTTGAAGPAGGVAVVPPLPGRVIEVRVRDGDPVEKGQVLLVLEAMKMRNEIGSPVAGTVRDLRVAPGANARAREPMLFVVPATGGPVPRTA